MKESRYEKIRDKNIKNKTMINLGIMITILVVIDQLIKNIVVDKLFGSSVNIINGVLDFAYVENSGGAYGIGNNSTLIFTVVSLILIMSIGEFILLKYNNINTSILFSLGLIIAGGLGNLIDRVFRGFVVDYIDVNPLIKFPIFNLADVCVVLGCMMIMINLLIEIINGRKK
jgi:signal peptidase II